MSADEHLENLVESIGLYQIRPNALHVADRSPAYKRSPQEYYLAHETLVLMRYWKFKGRSVETEHQNLQRK
jgi:hypothetical protein